MYIDISYVNKKWDDFVFGPFWYGPFLHLGRFRMGRFCMWAVLGWAVFVWDDLVSGPTSPESKVLSIKIKFNFINRPSISKNRLSGAPVCHKAWPTMRLDTDCNSKGPRLVFTTAGATTTSGFTRVRVYSHDRNIFLTCLK